MRNVSFFNRSIILFMAILWLVGLGGSDLSASENAQVKNGKPNTVIHYIAIGDSYTIGEGVAPEESWPALLTQHLADSGIDIRLVANPSRTGWTVQQAIDFELPVFEASNPGFATLLIGVNDWVQGSGRSKFTSGLRTLMDRTLATLPGKNRLLVITIPDFSCAPNGEKYGYGRNISKGISRYNEIIKEEARKRQLPVVDIFPLSQEACGRPDLVAEDGLHPSALEYARWEKLIFPTAYDMLKPMQ